MKRIIGLILSSLLLLSCSQNDNDNIAYRISEKDLIPEGITYSSSTNSFYLSSILKTKIIQIDAESGKFNDFTTSDSPGMRFLGMIVDEKQNNLWACGNLVKDDMFYSAVVKFNLITGELIKSFIYKDTEENIYNDLVQDKEGNVYFTNTSKQTIYIIDQQTDSVKVFFEDPQILHPNGITISPDNKYIYVASTEKGIRILDIKNQKIIDESDSTINSSGLDGLKFYNNSIIGIQNEVKHRSERKIARYYLNETSNKITRMEIIDQNNTHFDIPTTFVIVEDDLYCIANSQMGNVNWKKYEIRNYETLNDNIILKYKLK